jgi:hypothetical protein
MVPISALWMPILLSAVIVFVASSILHMVLPYHKSDYRKLPDEDKVVDVLRAAGVTPGPTYHFPHTTQRDMKSPDVAEKFKRGPVGLLTVIPSGPPAMGKYLGLWFVYCVVVSILVAIVAGTTLSAGTRYPVVFHLTALAALLGYGVQSPGLDLEGAGLERNRQARRRWIDLRAADRRDVWLAMAKVGGCPHMNIGGSGICANPNLSSLALLPYLLAAEPRAHGLFPSPRGRATA